MAISTEAYMELKSALKDALIELVHERRDLFRDIVREVLEENGTAARTEPHPSSESDDPFEQQVQAEIRAYHRLHPMLWETYPGEHVAIYGQNMVDHDKDYTALYQRIDEAYRDEFVLLRHVEKEPERELCMRSPRLISKPS